MKKLRLEASAHILINSDISFLSAFVSALKASFTSDVIYSRDEESHTYVLKSN